MKLLRVKLLFFAKFSKSFAKLSDYAYRDFAFVFFSLRSSIVLLLITFIYFFFSLHTSHFSVIFITSSCNFFSFFTLFSTVILSKLSTRQREQINEFKYSRIFFSTTLYTNSNSFTFSIFKRFIKRFFQNITINANNKLVKKKKKIF